MTIHEITKRFNARKNGTGWTAKCPAHDDKTPSLSINEGDNGKILLHCHAGCSIDQICAALNIRIADLKPDTDTPPPRPATPAPSRPSRAFQTAQEAAQRCTPTGTTLEALYEYPRHGKEFGTVARYKNAEGKTFRQFHADTAAKWTPGAPAGLWPLYNEADIPPEGRVIIVEGEKCQQAAASIGLPATTSAGGSKAATRSDWTPLAGREVVILPDNDKPGEAYAEEVSGILNSLTPPASVKIVRLPGLPEGGDIADFIAARRDQEPDAIRREIETFIDQAEDASPDTPPELPGVFLPNGERTISKTGRELGGLLAASQKFFIRGGALVRLETDAAGDPMLHEVKPAALASDFETIASLRRGDEKKNVPTTCGESTAKLIAASSAFRQVLPPIHVLTRCAVLTERAGRLLQISGYDRESGIYAAGQPAEPMSLDNARQLLDELFTDFNFSTPADRSRAIAAAITPALIFGGLLNARAPVDLGEADSSQSGKGFRNKLTAAIYSQTVRTVTQKKTGVGGLEESFNMALIRGANFIALDNVRGKIDSPAFESFLTEDRYSARVPFMADVEIDPRRVYVMLTSNRADVTTDLTNRCSCVRILKRPADYIFRQYSDGDILDHVRRNQPRFLGAVFAVVKAWHDAGKPRSTETRHDFRAWAQVLDWIVQHLLDAAPLMDGHRETQQRMINPVLNWLRDIALEVIRAQKADAWLRAGDLVELIADTEIETPGMPEHGDPADPDTRKAAQQATGRKLSTCFRSGDVMTVDGITIERREQYDATGRYNVREYRFNSAAIEIQPLAATSDCIAAEPTAETPKPEICGYRGQFCGYAAANSSADETHAAANATDTSLNAEHEDINSSILFSMGDISRIAAEHPANIEFEEGEI